MGDPLASAHSIDGLAAGWTETGDALLDSQQPDFTRSMTLDYGDLHLAGPESYSPGISTTSGSLPTRSLSDTGYGENVTGYEFTSELPVSPEEYEGAEEEAEEEEEAREEAEEAEPAPPAPPPKRKRGRPRLNRPGGSSSSSAAASAPKTSSRIPHTEVERKYRNALNAEMERLRANIPTLPQRDGAALSGPPRPSKAVVLAAAVDYIKQLEAETEKLTGENEELKRGESSGGSRRGRRRYDV